jgi:hypothetical protein
MPGNTRAVEGYLFSRSLRVALFVAVNLAALVAVGAGVSALAPSNPRILYVLLLTLLCSSPILHLDRINGRHFLLAVYLAVFFAFFGLSDFMGILTGETSAGDESVIGRSEWVILAAAALVIAGYHAGIRWLGDKDSRAGAGPREWPFRVVLGIGLAFWVVGTAGLMYWQTFVITDRTNASLERNLASLGGGLTTLFMLVQLIQPLGILLLAYAYAKYKRAYLFALILLVVLVQIVLGFVADFKGEAMQGGILVIITKTYVDGRLPKGWLLGGVLFILLVFPVFQAYRIQVRGEGGVTSLQTLENLVAIFQSSLQAEEKVSKGVGGSAYKAQSFWERSSLKPSVDLIVARCGNDKPYQWGATLTPLAAALIPKILWPDKPSLAVGQIFNREFSVSEVADTYISPSHVGEVYWNFGWIGIVLGFPVIGLVLGVIGSRCSGSPRVSVTRLLIVVVTIYAFAIGSEGTIAVAYVVWLRSMAAIWLLHRIFARRASALAPNGDPYVPALEATAAAGPRFSNLMR